MSPARRTSAARTSRPFAPRSIAPARLVGLAAAATTAVASVALVPAPASAAAPTHVVNTVTSVTCAFGTTTGEWVAFKASSSTADQSSGSGIEVEDQSNRTVLAGEGGTVTFGPRFSAAVAAADPDTGQVVGTATLTADVTQGEPQVEQVDERDGNIRTTGTVTTTKLNFTGIAASVPGFSLVPGELPCDGETIVFDVYTTNPRVHIVTVRGFDSDICDVAGISGAQVRLSGETRRAPYAEFMIRTESNRQKARGDVAMHGRAGVLRAPLIDYGTEQTVADLDLGVRLTRVQPPTTTLEQEDKTITVRTVAPYQAKITTKLSDGRKGQVSCPAAQVTTTRLTFRR